MPVPGGDPGQQHTAAQTELGDLRHLGDGFVEVSEQDLAHPGAPLGRQGAEVGQPAIVRTQAGPAQLELAGGLRWRGGQARLRKERRHGIGEDDLPRDAFGSSSALRRSLFQLRSASGSVRSPNGLTYVFAQLSNSSLYCGSRYSR